MFINPLYKFKYYFNLTFATWCCNLVTLIVQIVCLASHSHTETDFHFVFYFSLLKKLLFLLTNKSFLIIVSIPLIYSYNTFK